MRKILWLGLLVIGFASESNAQRTCEPQYDHWRNVSLDTINRLITVGMPRENSQVLLALTGFSQSVAMLEEQPVSELAEMVDAIGQWFTALGTELRAGDAILDCATPLTEESCEGLLAVYEDKFDALAREQDFFVSLVSSLFDHDEAAQPHRLHGTYRTTIMNSRKVINARSEFEPISGNYYRCRLGMSYIDNWTDDPGIVPANPRLGFSQED